MRKFVEFNDVYKRYKMGEVTINAANGISFGIEEGEFAIVVSPAAPERQPCSTYWAACPDVTRDRCLWAIRRSHR